MVANMVADMEVDMVADKELFEFFPAEAFGSPNFFKPNLILACASSIKLCEFILMCGVSRNSISRCCLVPLFRT